jgi:hypothetical protein
VQPVCRSNRSPFSDHHGWVMLTARERRSETWRPPPALGSADSADHDASTSTADSSVASLSPWRGPAFPGSALAANGIRLAPLRCTRINRLPVPWRERAFLWAKLVDAKRRPVLTLTLGSCRLVKASACQGADSPGPTSGRRTFNVQAGRLRAGSSGAFRESGHPQPPGACPRIR